MSHTTSMARGMKQEFMKAGKQALLKKGTGAESENWAVSEGSQYYVLLSAEQTKDGEKVAYQLMASPHKVYPGRIRGRII